MARLKKHARVFLKDLNKRYGTNIKNQKTLTEAIRSGRLPQEDWNAYVNLTDSGVQVFDVLVEEIGKRYLDGLDKVTKEARYGKQPSPSPSRPATDEDRARIKKEAADYRKFVKENPVTDPTAEGAPQPPGSSAPSVQPLGDPRSAEKDYIYTITGDTRSKTDEEIKAAEDKKKAEAGLSPLDRQQQEGMNKVIEAQNQQDIQDVQQGYDYDAFAAQQLGRIPQATGQIGELPRFGAPSDSRILNAYDQFVNTSKAKRTPMQQRIASAAPLLTGAANLAGIVGGGALGAKVGLPLAGATLGSRILGQGTESLARRFSTPKGRMASIAERLIPQQDIGTRLRRSIGNLASGQTTGLANYFSNRLGMQPNYRTGLARYIASRPGFKTLGNLMGGGKPAGFLESLRGTLTNPNFASNVRSGLEDSIALYELGDALGLNKYAGRALGAIGRKLGFGRGGNRIPEPSATGRETGQEHAGNIVSGLAGRYFPGRRQEIINEYGYDPGAYGESGILEGARAALTPQEAAYDIRRAGIRRREQEEGILGEGQRRSNLLERKREALRRRAQQQRFEERSGIQDLREQEAEMAAEINAQNRRLDTTGISLGQQAQPVPLRRQGYISSPTGEYIAQGLQGVQQVVGPYLFQGDQ